MRPWRCGPLAVPSCVARRPPSPPGSLASMPPRYGEYASSLRDDGSAPWSPAAALAVFLGTTGLLTPPARPELWLFVCTANPTLRSVSTNAAALALWSPATTRRSRSPCSCCRISVSLVSGAGQEALERGCEGDSDVMVHLTVAATFRCGPSES